MNIIEDNNPDHFHFVDVNDKDEIYYTTISEVDRKNTILRELGISNESDVPKEYTIKAHKLVITKSEGNRKFYSAVDNIEIDYPINQIYWPYIKIESQNK